MLAASTVGIFLIPMLYVTFQTGRERVKSRFAPNRAGTGGDSVHPPLPPN